jgi:hypothetical protein
MSGESEARLRQLFQVGSGGGGRGRGAGPGPLQPSAPPVVCRSRGLPTAVSAMVGRPRTPCTWLAHAHTPLHAHAHVCRRRLTSRPASSSSTRSTRSRQSVRRRSVRWSAASWRRCSRAWMTSQQTPCQRQQQQRVVPPQTQPPPQAGQHQQQQTACSSSSSSSSSSSWRAVMWWLLAPRTGRMRWTQLCAGQVGSHVLGQCLNMALLTLMCSLHIVPRCPPHSLSRTRVTHTHASHTPHTRLTRNRPV